MNTELSKFKNNLQKLPPSLSKKIVSYIQLFGANEDVFILKVETLLKGYGFSDFQVSAHAQIYNDLRKQLNNRQIKN